MTKSSFKIEHDFQKRREHGGWIVITQIQNKQSTHHTLRHRRTSQHDNFTLQIPHFHFISNQKPKPKNKNDFIFFNNYLIQLSHSQFLEARYANFKQRGLNAVYGVVLRVVAGGVGEEANSATAEVAAFR
ncbi:uncharacterized protein LOC116141707 isoform X2 [Pistacia vera]|nr:uncharacterized protein LOC116141707 isoform X2 [Pistacia vera]